MKSLVNIEYEVRNGKPIILLYLREGENREVREVDWFRPYFYANTYTPQNQLTYMTAYGKPRTISFSVEEQSHKTSIFGEQVYKVNYTIPGETAEIRKIFPKTYEADVEFPRRFLIDNFTELPKAEYRKLHIDIETTTELGFPDATNPQEKITVVTLYDNMSDKLVTFALLPDEKTYQIDEDLILNDKNGNLIKKYTGRILFFHNEIDMLESLLRAWSVLEVDLVLGYNVYFDILYLFARSQFLGIKLDDIFGYVRFDATESKVTYGQPRRQPRIRVKGSIVFDLLGPYKRIRSEEIPSYSLEYVATAELNMQQAKRRISNFSKAWKEDFVNFVIYNRQDTALSNSVEEKVQIVDFFEDIRSLSLLPRIDMCTIWSKVIDNILLTQFKENVYPTKIFVEGAYKKIREDENEDSGGYVMEPEPGFYEDVPVFDFFSMYPNIDITFNLSPECLVEPGTGDINIVVPIDGVQTPVSITLSKVGVLPKLIKYMLELRAHYTKMRDTTTGYEKEKWAQKRYAIKTTINAVYGVTLYESFRLHEKRIGRAITFLGRSLNKFVHEKFKQKWTNYPILYADTDSTFTRAPKEMMKTIQNTINQEFIPLFVKSIIPNKEVECTLYVEIDHHYDQILLTGKKHYIGREKNKFVFDCFLLFVFDRLFPSFF